MQNLILGPNPLTMLNPPDFILHWNGVISGKDVFVWTHLQNTQTKLMIYSNPSFSAEF
jgi:hypothetical protein